MRVLWLTWSDNDRLLVALAGNRLFRGQRSCSDRSHHGPVWPRAADAGFTICPADKPGFTRKSSLGPGTRHKAADLSLAVLFIRPHDGRPKTVRLLDNGGVGHVNPLSMETHAIVTLL